MWKCDGGTIQVDLGSAVAAAATASSFWDVLTVPFGPNALLALPWGDSAESGGLLLGATIDLRNRLRQQGLELPPVRYACAPEDELGPHEVVVYFGIEPIQRQVTGCSGLLSLLEFQVERYHHTQTDASSLTRVLSRAQELADGDPDRALGAFEFVYYHASRQGLDELAVTSLALAGEERARRGDFGYAATLLVGAHQRIYDDGVDLPWLLPSLALTAAETLGYCGDWERANAGFELALIEACAREDLEAVVLALLGLVVARGALGDETGKDEVIGLLEQLLGSSVEAQTVVTETRQLTAATSVIPTSQPTTDPVSFGTLKSHALTAAVTLGVAATGAFVWLANKTMMMNASVDQSHATFTGPVVMGDDAQLRTKSVVY
jgi:hypothetical protein